MQEIRNNAKLVEKRVSSWEGVLSKTSSDEKLWSSLEKWWTGLVANHDGVDGAVRQTHLRSFGILKNMSILDVRQMLDEYEHGDYPDSENLERESIIHLFLAIIQNHHKLW